MEEVNCWSSGVGADHSTWHRHASSCSHQWSVGSVPHLPQLWSYAPHPMSSCLQGWGQVPSIACGWWHHYLSYMCSIHPMSNHLQVWGWAWGWVVSCAPVPCCHGPQCVLAVIGCSHHPLIILTAMGEGGVHLWAACVVYIPVSRVLGGYCDMARWQEWPGAYLAWIPPHRSLNMPLYLSKPTDWPHIPFGREEGGSTVGVVCLQPKGAALGAIMWWNWIRSQKERKYQW